jgi:hypothetical protein
MSTSCTHLMRLGAAVLASAAALICAGGAASATTTGGATSTTGNSGSNAVPTTLAGIKVKASTDITNRVHALNAAITRVNDAKVLGSGRSTLDAYLGADISPLNQLNTKIQGDGTVKEAAHDFSTIFSGYRVYVLVLPATWIAADADRVTTTAIPGLTNDSTRAQTHENAGNQAELKPLVNDLNSQISTATDATGDLATNVLAVTPTQWNGNHNVLARWKASDQTADAAILKGRADVRQIVQDLRGSGVSAGSHGAGTGLRGSGLRDRSGSTSVR